MSARRRYRFNEETKAMEEVPLDYVGEGFSAGGHKSQEEVYGGARTLDGVDISSPTKRNAYMKATGTTDPGDFKSHWASNRERILRERSGDFDRRGRRESLGRAAYEVQSRRGTR